MKGARARAKAGELAFGTVDSWLVWNLTGGKVHVTDASNASRTMLFNIHDGRLGRRAAEDLRRAALDAAGGALVERSLRRDRRCSARRSRSPASRATSRRRCSARPARKPGMAKNTYGTGCFMLMNTGTKPIASKNNLLTTVAWRIGDRTEYALEGSIFIAGAVVQWLRDGLGLIRSSAEVEALAASVPDTGGVYLVPAFAGLGAPHWDQYARGTIIGLTRGTTKAHIARAALEGIALQVADVLQGHGSRRRDQAEGAARRRRRVREQPAHAIPGRPARRARRAAQGRRDHGARRRLSRRPRGRASGRTRRTSRAQWQVDKRFKPAMKPAVRTRIAKGWVRALGRARAWEES